MSKLLKAALLLAVLSNTACIRARQPLDFRPQSGLSAATQSLPVRLDAIHAESRANLSATLTGPAPCGEALPQGGYRLAVCSNPEDIRRFNASITQPLEAALRQSFAQTRLFSHTAARGVRLKATILAFDMHEGLINQGNLRVRYEFVDSTNGNTVFSADIDSTAREMVISPIDMGQSYDDAMQQTVQENIRKLLRRLQDSRHTAVFSASPSEAKH